MENNFLKAINTKNTYTENGALTNATTLSALADNFGLAGNYRGRSYEEVAGDQAALWEENKLNAIKFIFYLRLITRKIKSTDGFVTEKVQNGQGNRDESFKRLLWLAAEHKEAFYENLWLLPIVGSWKDLWTLMRYDAKLHLNCLDRNKIYELIGQGIMCEEHCELIKKFMPRIKSKHHLKTSRALFLNKCAKELAGYLKWDYITYNKFKSSGTAHTFQKLMCAQMYDKINWNAIPGRALNLLIHNNFLEKHSLTESYINWLDKQEVAKFTGYPYELFKEFMDSGGKLSLYKKHTLDKQFEGLIQTAKENGTTKENVWCALDTSGSMFTPTQLGVTCYDVCVSLGIFFSTLNEGAFHKHVVMFDYKSSILKLNGSFTEMVNQIAITNTALGDTNFQSIIDLLCKTRVENPNIPLEDYPSKILVVSDMEFNPPCAWKEVTSIFGKKKFIREKTNFEKTNFEEAKKKIAEVFPQEYADSLQFIWWNVASRNKQFPSTIDDGGTFFLSGADGSIISMLLGTDAPTEKEQETPKTMEELIEAALNQEILQQVSVERKVLYN